MNLNATTLALALALSGASLSASATQLGVLGELPQVQTLTIGAPDVSFSAQYFFSLAQATTVSADTISLNLNLGGKPILGITDFSLKLFDDASNKLLAVGTTGDGGFHIEDMALGASKYYFQVAGLTSGQYGGSYMFAAASATPPVPEPASLALMAVGMLVIGIMRLRGPSRNWKGPFKQQASLAAAGHILS